MGKIPDNGEYKEPTKDEHNKIADFLVRHHFTEDIKKQTGYYDDHNQYIALKEYEREILPNYLEQVLRNFSIEFRIICKKAGYKDESLANVSRLTKAINFYLKKLCREKGVNPPIQLFFYHKNHAGDVIRTYKCHLACAETGRQNNSRPYSYNITTLESSKTRRERGEDDYYIHAVPVDPNFVGRCKEIKFLNNAWKTSSVYYAGIIAWGGFGKSVLVRQWIEEIKNSSSGILMPKNIFWWSFYQNNSVDAFLHSAIIYLNPQDHIHKNLYRYTEEGFDMLTSLLRRNPGILILDGFEDMQYSQSGDYFGKCKNYQLSNFMRRICEGDCPTCLCVTTSRLPINDLLSFENDSYQYLNLENSPLDTEEARQLLRKHGVSGDDSLLDDIVQEHGGHPLALATIASLLCNNFDGDAKKISLMPSVAVPNSIIGDRFKLWRTFSWYDSLLNNAERSVLRMIGFFRQLAPSKLLLALSKANANFIGAKNCEREVQMRAIITHLSQMFLIRTDTKSDTYYMHPLWKNFYSFSVNRETATQYHKMLFDILQKEPANTPDTLPQMWPLIEAVYHGCKCGHEKDALNIFRERIERKSGYLTKQLAAWETKVDLCSMFFSGKDFSGECVMKNLEEQGHLLNAAGFAYLNMGLPVKAIPLFDRAAYIYSKALLKNDEGQVHRNRADSFLRMGNLESVIDASSKALELDESPKSQQSALGYLGYAHAMMGHFDQAGKVFGKALTLFGEAWLPPIRGIQYAEMLILKEENEKAIVVIRKMLAWVKKQKILFSEAECIRILAGVLAKLACISGKHKTAQWSIKLIEKALNMATRAGVHYYYIHTVLDCVRITGFLTLKKQSNLTKTKIKSLRQRINEVQKASRESGYRSIEAEAFFISSIVYLLENNHQQARKDIGYAINLSHELKYKCLENECSRLKNEVNL